MSLQQAINELRALRDTISRKIQDIDEAIPVLERLQGELTPIIPSAAKSESAKEKACNKCKFLQPLDSFPIHKDCKDGHQGTCKSCKRAEDIKRKEGTHKKNYKIIRPPAKIVTDNPPAPPVGEVICDQCHCKFSTQKGLDSHNELMHSGAPKAFNSNGKHPCPHCNKRFGTSVGLGEHIELRHPGRAGE